MLTGLGSAQEITVSPSNFHEDIVAGETIEKEVDVSWSGDAKTVVEMKSEYANENGTVTEGFYTDYSPQEFVLDSGETKTVDVSMETSTALVPDKYFISFKATTETELESETIRETNVIDHTEEIGEEYEEQLEELREELNETKKQLEESESDLEELRQIRDELESQGEDTEDITRTIQERQDRTNQLESDLQEKQNQFDELNSRMEEASERSDDLEAILFGTIAGLVLGAVLLLGYVGIGKYRDDEDFMSGMPGKWNQGQN